MELSYNVRAIVRVFLWSWALVGISLTRATVTTLALPSSLNGAKSIATSSNGKYLVVADTNANYINALDMANRSAWLLKAGSGSQGYLDSGTPSLALFSSPFGVAAQESSAVVPLLILVTDTGNHCIRKITWGSPWGVGTLAGGCTTSGNADGSGIASRFNTPKGIAVAGTDTAYIADTGNTLIRKLVISTTVVTTVTVTFPSSTPAIYVASLVTSQSTLLWLSAGVAAGTRVALVLVNITGASVVSTNVFTDFGGSGVAVGLPDANGKRWVYVANITGVGSIRAVNAANVQEYATTTGVATSVVLGMSVNTTSGALLGLVNSGAQIGVITGIATASGGAIHHTKIFSPSNDVSRTTPTATLTVSPSKTIPSATYSVSQSTMRNLSESMVSRSPVASQTSSLIATTRTHTASRTVTLSNCTARAKFHSKNTGTATSVVANTNSAAPSSLGVSRHTLVTVSESSSHLTKATSSTSWSPSAPSAMQPSLVPGTWSASRTLTNASRTPHKSTPSLMSTSTSPTIAATQPALQHCQVPATVGNTPLLPRGEGNAVVTLQQTTLGTRGVTSTDRTLAIFTLATLPIGRSALIAAPKLGLNVTTLAPLNGWARTNVTLAGSSNAAQLTCATVNTGSGTSIAFACDPPVGGWIPSTTPLYADRVVSLNVSFACGVAEQSLVFLVVSVPAPGASRPLAQAVTSATQYSQLVSAFASGATSGAALGRVMATSTMVLCDAGAAVEGGGVLDLGLAICGDVDSALVVARGAVVGNIVLVAAALAALACASLAWAVVGRAPLLECLVVFCMPSSLLPALIAVVPTTTASATFLLSQLAASECAAIDAVLAVCGAVLALCPCVGIAALWRTSAGNMVCGAVAAGSHGDSSSAALRTRWVRAHVSRLTRRRWKWCATAVGAPSTSTVLMRSAWVVLLDYRLVWFAAVDAAVLATIACLGVVSGLGGTGMCRGWSVVTAVLLLAELAVMCHWQPFTTYLSFAFSALSLLLTCLSVVAQLVFVMLPTESPTVWLPQASAVCSMLIVGITAAKVLVDMQQVVGALWRRLQGLLAVRAGASTNSKEQMSDITMCDGNDEGTPPLLDDILYLATHNVEASMDSLLLAEEHINCMDGTQCDNHALELSEGGVVPLDLASVDLWNATADNSAEALTDEDVMRIVTKRFWDRHGNAKDVPSSVDIVGDEITRTDADVLRDPPHL